MAWLGAFIWKFTYKEKNTDTTSETKSQHEQKGFYFFLSNPSEEEQQKPQKTRFCRSWVSPIRIQSVNHRIQVNLPSLLHKPNTALRLEQQNRKTEKTVYN